jgi:hypothetical protein
LSGCLSRRKEGGWEPTEQGVLLISPYVWIVTSTSFFKKKPRACCCCCFWRGVVRMARLPSYFKVLPAMGSLTLCRELVACTSRLPLIGLSVLTKPERSLVVSPEFFSYSCVLNRVPFPMPRNVSTPMKSPVGCLRAVENDVMLTSRCCSSRD